MTAPLGSRVGFSRPALSVPSSTAPVPAMARNTALSVPDSPVSMMAAAPLVRVTADHLALIRDLISSGQNGRAMELLDSVWHARVPEEQCWYLRLWVLAAQGRVIDALDLARTAAQELPGSAAVAYLQAALEHANHSPAMALEAARRAALIAPDHVLTRELVSLLSGGNETAQAGKSEKPVESGESVAIVDASRLQSNSIPNPVAAAQAGAALLYPLGSGRAVVPVLEKSARRPPTVPPATHGRRRFGVIAAATVICALWAIHDPVPAALVLGATVILATRGWRD